MNYSSECCKLNIKTEYPQFSTMNKEELTVKIAKARAHLQELTDELAQINAQINAGQECFRQLFLIARPDKTPNEIEQTLNKLHNNIVGYSKKYLRNTNATYLEQGVITFNFAHASLDIHVYGHTKDSLTTELKLSIDNGIVEVASDYGEQLKISGARKRSKLFKILIKRLNKMKKSNPKLIMDNLI